MSRRKVFTRAPVRRRRARRRGCRSERGRCVPVSASRPPSRTAILSAPVDGVEAVGDHEHRASVGESLQRGPDQTLALGSRPDVGSSMMSTGASLRKARAMAIRCASPHSSRPTLPDLVS